MLVALDIHQTREYTSPRDQGEPKTVFVLGVLDSALAARLNDSTFGWRRNDKGPEQAADLHINRQMRNREIVRFGLKGWKNLAGADDQLVEFDPKVHRLKSVAVPDVGNREGLSDIALDLLKPYLSELAAVIEADNIITKEEEKNSDTPSTLS